MTNMDIRSSPANVLNLASFIYKLKFRRDQSVIPEIAAVVAHFR